MSRPDGHTSFFSDDTVVRNFKGGLYQIITHASHHETGEGFVIYRCQRSGLVWARPVSDFYSYIDEMTPRFEEAR